AVQPKAHSGALGDFHQAFQAPQPVMALFAPAASKANGVVGHKDAMTRRKAIQQARQPVELRFIHTPARVPEPAIRNARIERYEPRISNALGERIHGVVHPLSLLPRGTETFEGAGL